MENSTGVWRGDNSTGAWLPFVPSDTTNTTSKRGVPADCDFAANHGTRMYWHDCQSQWKKGADVLGYRITISGTGYVCKGYPMCSLTIMLMLRQPKHQRLVPRSDGKHSQQGKHHR